MSQRHGLGPTRPVVFEQAADGLVIVRLRGWRMPRIVMPVCIRRRHSLRAWRLRLGEASRLPGPNVMTSPASRGRLKGLTGLKGLALRSTQVSDAGVAELRNALPNCRIIGP
jgi:hypothetical protein